VKSRFSALTKEAFDRFLDWIGPTGSQAADQYVLLQRKLETYFAGRGCGEFASELASQVTVQNPMIVDFGESGGWVRAGSGDDGESQPVNS
jgi:hypothetical protein